MKENPNLIAKKYAEIAAVYGDMVETRVTYKTQKMPLFISMMDKHSSWGFDNGLKTMIPSVLHLSILGYNYVVPAIIGKSGFYNSDPDAK